MGQLQKVYSEPESIRDEEQADYESMPEFKRYSEVGEVAIENAEGIDSIITELDNIIADLNQKIVNTLHRVVREISVGAQWVLTLWSHILRTLTKKISCYCP